MVRQKRVAHPQNYHAGLRRLQLNALQPPLNPNLTNNPNGGWGYYTEQQLQDMLFKNLDFLYNEAFSKLVFLGYDEDLAMNAILTNGHCYGELDVLNNILHNTLSYLTSNNENEERKCFADLKQLKECSLAGMICFLQQVKPHLSEGDAMWCLLMNDLHVGRASMMEIPLRLPQGDGSSVPVSGTSDAEGAGTGLVGVVPSMCKFHGGWGFGSGGASEFPVNSFSSNASEFSLQREIEYPKRFNFTPAMKTLLNRNVAALAAAFRPNSQCLQNQSQACPRSLPGDGPSSGGTSAVESGHSDETKNLNNQEVINSVLSKLDGLNLDENSEQGYGQLDKKDETLLSLIQHIKDLERQVKERKEWAHQKAIQAARKLSGDLTELKTLRMEREAIQRLNKGKQAVEDLAMKRLTDMETALRKVGGRVDSANQAVRKPEMENAEIRAELEASKLSASESAATCAEVLKREKKHLKKLAAWEKQKIKLREDISTEEEKILNLQQQLVEVEAAEKEAEAKWRQEQQAKEEALAQVKEERRLKEVAEDTNKRNLEALRLCIEIDFQQHKDELQRLEEELSRLKSSSAQTTTELPRGDVGARMQQHFDRLEDSVVSGGRECLICMKDEVSIVFLPCAHQVLCARCNENYGNKGRATCPCCWAPIEQRIGVFGATSY